MKDFGGEISCEKAIWKVEDEIMDNIKENIGKMGCEDV
jgi:hypothetical protein